MSVIFPAGTSNRMAFNQIPNLKKQAEFDFEEEVKEDIPEASLEVAPEAVSEESPVGIEEEIVSDVSDIEEPNPAFDAIRSLPGFEADVAEIDALESEGGEVAAGDVGAAAAKIEDAALQIADAAAQLAGAPADGACPCDKPAEEAFVEISIDDEPGGLEVVEVPESLEEPSTEKKEDDKPADDKPADDNKDEEKKDEPAESEKVEKEGCGATAAVDQGTEKTASIKQGVPSRDFVEVAKLSPENKTFLRTYWKDILGFPPEYVDAMTKDYEK